MLEGSAHELACVVSAAGFVNAPLLRHLRFAFVERADAGDEAAVWWSRLVESRGVNGFTFRADVLDTLRDELSSHPRRDEIVRAVKTFHAGGPAMLVFEEELVEYALKKESVTRLDARLAVAVEALSDEARADEVFAWAARSLHRLPSRARSTPSWFMLTLAVSERQRAIGTEGQTTTVTIEQWRRALPTTNVEIAIREDNGLLVAARSPLFDKFEHAVGRVVANGLATGFVVDHDLVLTAAHVVGDLHDVVFEPENRSLPAQVIYVERQLDYALLRVAVNAPSLRLVRTPPRAGMEIIAPAFLPGRLGTDWFSVRGTIITASPLELSVETPVPTGLAGGPVMTVDGVVGILTREDHRRPMPGRVYGGVLMQHILHDARRSIELVSYSARAPITVPATNPPVVVVREGETQRSVGLSDEWTALGEADRINGVGNWRGDMWSPRFKPTQRHASVGSTPIETSSSTATGLEVTLLPAEHGDAIWIRWPDGPRTRQMMIDMGTASVGKRLRRRFEALPQVERDFELLVLTHLDADRTGGVLSCMVDDPIISFQDIWFNGLQHVTRSRDHVPKGTGGLRGRLMNWLEGQPWNRAFEGERICREREHLPRISLPGGLFLTVLGPTVERLAALGPTMERMIASAPTGDEFAVEGIDREDEEQALDSADQPEVQATKQVPVKALRLESRSELEALSRRANDTDKSVANGSSIVLMLEFQGQRILFAGDAFARDLVEAITLLNRGKTVQFDAFKVSHGGSRNNMTRQLVEALDCSRYMFSTDGRFFKHPDSAAVACVLAYAKRPIELAFNYRSVFTNQWDAPDLKMRYGYETRYGDASSGLVVNW